MLSPKVSAHWLRTFCSAIAGGLTITLSSCSGFRVPNTLFITYGASDNDFKDERADVRLFMEKYTEAFQRSNPNTRIIYITYPNSEFSKQISLDSSLNLGPDLILVTGINGILSQNFLAENVITTLPDKEYFDAIYNSQIQYTAKDNGNYSFAPWVVNAQVACFNNTKIKRSPETVEDLEALSARGYKIGLSSSPGSLIWSAGTQGAIAEISSIGNQTTGGKQHHPAIQAWLEWVRKAALYQNILFEPDDLLVKDFQDNKLDWITCWGSQIENLKSKMGTTLSIAALPNGDQSKASPPIVTYGFALGKNSSPTQRQMALKFIKTNVNTIAQRKLQLSDTGFLGANQKVSIPPESSKKLNALNTSVNEQNNAYSKEWPGVYRWFGFRKNTQHNAEIRFQQLATAFSELTNGYLNVNEAMKTITSTTMN